MWDMGMVGRSHGRSHKTNCTRVRDHLFKQWMVIPNPSTALFKQSGLWSEACFGLCPGRGNVLNVRTEYSGLVPYLALVVTHELCPNKELCQNMHDQDLRKPFQGGLLVFTLIK